SRPLEATSFEVEGVRWTYVFYESGLSINVLYTLEDSGKRAVGSKLADGMEIPDELATASSSSARGPGLPVRSAVRISSSRASTDVLLAVDGGPCPASPSVHLTCCTG